MLEGMNRNSILFALANPIPEIWPEEAKKAGVSIVATGRSDFPNQVNNSLMFPSILRGVLDVRSKAIPDEAIIAAAEELAACAQRNYVFDRDHILPSMMDFEIYPAVASAVGQKCIELGIARKNLTRRELLARATDVIENSRKMTQSLQESHLIRPLPNQDASV